MAKRPNLLYVFADQLRRTSCGYTGYKNAQTPNIDALHAESMDFCQAVSGHPVCAPYRATLFTGKYTSSTGMVINEIRINPNQRCIGHVLTEGGYETAFIGKWHLYADELGNHFDPKNSFVPKGPDRLGFDDFWAAYGFHHEYFAPHAYHHEDGPQKIYEDKYEPYSQVDLAIRQLERLHSNPDKPFAMFLSLGVPHDPWIPENVPADVLARFNPDDYDYPPNYLPEDDPHGDSWAHLSEEERKELPSWMRCYDAMVACLDESIGILMNAVKRMGLDEDTIIVFSSDHGECFGAHGRRAKNIFYEEAVRVPFFLRMPGGKHAAANTDALLNTVDLMPTLCDLLDLECPKDVQGQSLAGIITGENANAPKFQFMQGMGAVAAWGDGYEWRGLRNKQFTYAKYRVDGMELLFDHVNDPYQMHNLIDDPAYADVLKEMKMQMQAEMTRINDNFEPSSYYQNNWIEERHIMRTATENYETPAANQPSKVDIPRPEYPRPQFVRSEWMNLNGEWQFEIDHGCSGRNRGMLEKETLDSKIIVPFCPESELSGVNYKDFMACVWYKRTIELPKEAEGKHVYLNFGAVDYRTEVWVNGQSVGKHEGGYASFSLEITKAVKPGENTILICAEDNTRDGMQPTGKQSTRFDSHGCLYTRTTGIWQTVWMEWMNEDHFRQVYLTPDAANSTLHIRAKLHGGKNCTLKVATAYKDDFTGNAEAKCNNGWVEATVQLTKTYLWNVGDGKLYDLQLQLVNENGEVVDSLSSYFGLRSVGFDGMKFVINGKPVFQRLVLDQGFYPDGIYTAPTEEALKHDIELSLAMGFNGARLHEKVFEPRFLYWADRMGYLCWGEMGNWGLDHTQIGALNAFTKEWLEIVARDFSSPAIIGWCPFNETWDKAGTRQNDDVLRMVYRMTKSLDSTRPCIDTSGNYHVESDIHDVHDYVQDPEEFGRRYGKGTEPIYERFPDRQKRIEGQPVFVSEYGGIRWSDDTSGWGYGEGPKTEEEFLARYKGLTDVLLDNPDHFAFCYTQLTDVEQEQNGLYTYDRKPKFDPAIIHAINSRKAAMEEE